MSADRKGRADGSVTIFRQTAGWWTRGRADREPERSEGGRFVDQKRCWRGRAAVVSPWREGRRRLLAELVAAQAGHEVDGQDRLGAGDRTRRWSPSVGETTAVGAGCDAGWQVGWKSARSRSAGRRHRGRAGRGKPRARRRQASPPILPTAHPQPSATLRPRRRRHRHRLDRYAVMRRASRTSTVSYDAVR